MKDLNKEQLEKQVNVLVKDLGKIKLGEMLAGGVVSDVYSATLKTKNEKYKNIVVKYTRSNICENHIFSHTDIKNTFSVAYLTQDLDVQIQSIITAQNPKILLDFPKENITIMENFSDQGFILLQNLFLEEKEIATNLAKNLGETLAKIRQDLEKNSDKFKQIEDSRNQFDERFYELKALLYNGRMEIFNQIEKDFLTSDFLSWTDGDYKNFAVNSDGEVICFDFGRIVKCDLDFMLPNLLGHLGLFVISGHFEIEKAMTFFKNCIENFEDNYKKANSNYEIDEVKFVNYFTASLLHRGMAMRWVDQRIADKIGEDSLKSACMHFGDVVFDKGDRITKIEEMFGVLEKVSVLAKEGKYKRPSLC